MAALPFSLGAASWQLVAEQFAFLSFADDVTVALWQMWQLMVVDAVASPWLLVTAVPAVVSPVVPV